MDKFYPIAVVELPPEDGGGYLGFVPDLKGCLSHGDTPEEALANAKDAILEWIDEAKESGMAIPEPGTAAALMKKDRARLVQKLVAQKDAFLSLERDFKALKGNVEALRDMLAGVSDRMVEQQPVWAFVAVDENAKRKVKSKAKEFH